MPAANLTKIPKPQKDAWVLRLYVAGQTPKSVTAFANLKRICAEHLADKYIRAISPFRIYYKVLTAEEKLLVFTRASKIEIRYHPALVNMLDKINTGETLEVHALLQELAQDWPEEAGLYFLSLIYNKRGIEIV